MTVLKNKNFWLVLFLMVLGMLLRLIFIDKPEGLWNDEYTSWAIASIPFGKEFFKSIAMQCHMPFYYLYLKFFIHFLGNSDLMLRTTSVLSGVIAIPVMYFVGKEFKNEKLGILCAAFTALSSFLIYFSQEVRLYGVLFLFSALLLISTLKLLKNQTRTNIVFFAAASFFVMFTHTIGFVFVLFNLIFVFYNIAKTGESEKKAPYEVLISVIVLGLITAPLTAKILFEHSFSQWWAGFSLSKIGFLFTDYFSPILTNIVSAPENFFYNFSFSTVIFEFLPTVICVIGLINALKRGEKATNGLFLVCLGFVVVQILAAILGKLVFLTKYTIEIYPTLIVLVSFGLLSIKNKTLSKFLIFAFIFLSTFYILTNPNSAPKLHRSEGHKLVANLLKNADLKKDDIILLNYYSEEKYGKYFDFSPYRVYSINKVNFTEFLYPQTDFKTAVKEGKKLYKDTFSNPEDKFFDKKFKADFADKLKPHQKIAVVILNDVSMYSPTQIQAVTGDEKQYKKAPLPFLVFSYVKNKTLENGLKTLSIKRIEQKGSWSVITFEKR